MVHSLHRSIGFSSSLLFLLTLFGFATPLVAQTDEVLAFTPVLSVEVGGIEEFTYLQSPDKSGKIPIVPPLGDHFAIHRHGGVEHIDLLPVLFFDQGSSMISERYRQFFSRTETYGFNEHENNDLTVVWNRNAKYYDLLNIVAARMINMKKGSISLQGYYSDEPGESALLADERAKSVRNYLCDVWRIDSSRIHLLPSVKGGKVDDNFLKKEEYRRVVITADSSGLLRPVTYTISYGNEELYQLRMTVDPKSVSGTVHTILIELRWHRQLVGSAVIHGSSDSTIYHLTGIWKLPRRTDQIIYYPIEAQAILYYTDGSTARTNTVSLRTELVFDSDSPMVDNTGTNDLIGNPRGSKKFTSHLRFLDLEDGREIRWDNSESFEPLLDALSAFSARERRTIAIVITSNTDAAQLSDLDASAATHSIGMTDFDQYNRMLADSNYSIPLYILPDPVALRAPVNRAAANSFINTVWNGLMTGQVYHNADGDVVQPQWAHEGESAFDRRRPGIYEAGKDQLRDYMKTEGERQQRVVQYIRSRVDSSAIRSIEIGQFSSTLVSERIKEPDYVPVHYPIFTLPEERMYDRQVEVEIVLSGG